MFKVDQKMGATRRALSRWIRDVFGNTTIRIQKLTEENRAGAITGAHFLKFINRSGASIRVVRILEIKRNHLETES